MTCEQMPKPRGRKAQGGFQAYLIASTHVFYQFFLLWTVLFLHRVGKGYSLTKTPQGQYMDCETIAQRPTSPSFPKADV